MSLKKHFLEALTLVIAAALCAVVANAVASRDRKIALVGNYPNALKVPGQSSEPMAVTSANSVRLDTAANEVPASSSHPITSSGGLPVAPAAATTVAAAITGTTAGAMPGSTTGASASSPQIHSVPARTAEPRTAVSAPPPPLPPSTADSSLARFPIHEKQPYVELHGDDVAWLYQHGALFLDARRTSVYEQGHIAGARSFPVWEADIDDRVNKIYEERGNDSKVAALPIVVYCSGGDCEDSHMLAQKLWGVQFNNVYVYKDGFPDWEKRGGRVHTGDAP